MPGDNSRRAGCPQGRDADLTAVFLHRKYECLPTAVSVDSMSFATGPSDHSERRAANDRKIPRQSPDRRFRLPGHPTHRAAGAGGEGLFGDCAVPEGGAGLPGHEHEGGAPARAPGFKVLGTSPNAPIAMIGDDARKFYATQFHLEVMHTPHGAAILRNFVRK